MVGETLVAYKLLFEPWGQWGTLTSSCPHSDFGSEIVTCHPAGCWLSDIKIRFSPRSREHLMKFIQLETEMHRQARRQWGRPLRSRGSAGWDLGLREGFCFHDVRGRNQPGLIWTEPRPLPQPLASFGCGGENAPILLPRWKLRTILGSVPTWLELNSRPQACLSGFPAEHSLQGDLLGSG